MPGSYYFTYFTAVVIAPHFTAVKDSNADSTTHI